MSLGRDATSELAKAEVEEHGKVLKGGPAATAQVFRQLPIVSVQFPVFAGMWCYFLLVLLVSSLRLTPPRARQSQA